MKTAHALYRANHTKTKDFFAACLSAAHRLVKQALQGFAKRMNKVQSVMTTRRSFSLARVRRVIAVKEIQELI